jgi:hypothetical protein
VLTPEVLHLRLTHVVQYLTALERASHTTWQAFAVDAATLPERLVLVHPGWHRGDVTAQLLLQSFSGSLTGSECQSDRLWGYDCPLTSTQIHCDHVFPRALGGPRDGTNQVWLCALHNGWKSSDLFAYPWEVGEPHWLQGQLTRVSGLLPPDATWSGA